MNKLEFFEPEFIGMDCYIELQLFSNVILHYKQGHNDYRTRFSDFNGNVYVFEDDIYDNGISFLKYISIYKEKSIFHKPKYIYYRIKFLISLI